MSVKDLIFIRSEMNEYTEQDLNAFTSRLYAMKGRKELLSTAIFLLLRSKIGFDGYYQDVKTVVDQIKKEKLKEEEAKRRVRTHTQSNIQNVTNHELTIHDLPYDMITYCAQFLILPDVARFIVVNRSIYMACRQTTNFVTALRTTNVSKEPIEPYIWYDRLKAAYPNYKERNQQLQLYKKAKDVALKAVQIPTMKFVFTALEKLQVSCLNLKDIPKIIDKMPTYPALQTISFMRGGTKSQNQEKVVSLLKGFIAVMVQNKYIQNLEFTKLRIDPQKNVKLDGNDIMNIKSLQHIEGLAVQDIEGALFADTLISTFAPNLKSFHFNSFSQQSLLSDSAKVKLSNVEELCVIMGKFENEVTNLGLISSISESIGDKLQRVAIYFSLGTHRISKSFNKKEKEHIQSFFGSVIDQKDLHQISIAMDDGSGLGAIVKALEHQISNGGCNLAAVFTVHFEKWTVRDLGDSMVITCGLMELAELLKKWTVGKFAIKFFAPFRSIHQKEIQKFEQNLQSLQSSQHLEILSYEKGNKKWFIVCRNKKTDGCSKRWQFKCCVCQPFV